MEIKGKVHCFFEQSGQNAPMKLRKYERITVRFKVTKETRERLTEKECRMRKWQLGNEYSVTGCFDGWYIHEDGNGEMLPILNGGESYSRFDELLSIERAEQITERTMNVKPTIDDLPAKKRNCSTCEYRGYDCPRMNKRYPHGFITNSFTGEISGMIACCPNYQGRY